MTETKDENVMLSPKDIESLKKCQDSIGEAMARLQDLPDETREEFGDLEDALRKLEDADELVAGCIPGEPADPPADPEPDPA